MPQWLDFFRSKCMCLRCGMGNIDEEERIQEVRQQASDLRKHLGLVSEDEFLKLVVGSCFEGTLDIELDDLVQLFEDEIEDPEESRQKCKDWMVRFSSIANVPMQRSEAKLDTPAVIKNV